MRTVSHDSIRFSIRFIYEFDTVELICIYGLVRAHTVSHGLVRSLIRLYTDIAPVPVFFKFKKSYTAYTDTLEWPECKSDKATVYSVVCTVYTGGQPCKPCVLCETGLRNENFVLTV